MRFSTQIITLPSFRKYDLLLLFLKNRVHTDICRVMYFFPVSVRSSPDVLDKDQSLYLPSPAQTKATYRLARNMCKKDSSFVTIISGCDVSDEDAEKVTEIVKAKCPNHVEVSHIRGGQPVYYYMISVE